MTPSAPEKAGFQRPPRLAASWTGWCFAAAAAAGLTACSEPERPAETVKQVQTTAVPKAPPATGPQVKGRYKIGKPYQVQGTWYYPRVEYDYLETGIASWYGPGFDGKATANGETYDQDDLTAAHRTLPMPSMVRVTNLENGRSLKLRINDRGPFARGRIIDVSRRAADLLGFKGQGTAKVRVELLEGESRRLAAAAQGLEQKDTTPAAAPTVAVAVAPLGPVTAAPLSSGSGGGGSRINGTALTHSEPLSAGRTLESAARSAVPEPDGVVTILPDRAQNLYVQAGSFLYYHNANRLRVKLLPVGRASVDPKLVNGRYFFRVRFGPLATVDDADRLFNDLISKGHNDTRIVVE